MAFQGLDWRRARGKGEAPGSPQYVQKSTLSIIGFPVFLPLSFLISPIIPFRYLPSFISIFFHFSEEAEKALFSPHSTPKVRQMAEKVEAVASQGFPPAQLLIGQCFLRGAGGLFPMDLGMAFKWIQGALRGGEEGAQGELQGICGERIPDFRT